MKVLQSIYTSCRVGQSGYSGFQFYSYSDGLTDEELLEISRIGNYIAPLNLPSHPTKEEIERQFPASFNYFRLSSGRVGVIQSVALTQDYSGRSGNFIAHAFVLESEEFPFLPILLYKSDSFKTDLSDEEWNLTTIPEKLPALEVTDLLKNPAISLENLSAFLEDHDTEDFLPKLINAIIAYSETRRRIILADQPENIMGWITALSFAFPLKLANTLTFSTYSMDPANHDFVIGATSPEGNRFDFYNEMAFNYQFYVFNFALQRFSSIDYKTIYAEIANTAMSISYHHFENLKLFFNQYDFPVINKNIDLIYKLFESANNNLQYQEDGMKLIEFMEHYAKEECLHKFLSDYQNYLSELLKIKYLNIKEVEKLFSLLIQILKKTYSDHNFILLFDLYISWLFNVIDHASDHTFPKEYLSCKTQDLFQINSFNLLKDKFFDHTNWNNYTFRLLSFITDPKLFISKIDNFSLTIPNEILHTIANHFDIVQLILFAHERNCAQNFPKLIEQFEEQINITALETQEYSIVEKISLIKKIREIKSTNQVCELWLLLFKIKQKANPDDLEALTKFINFFLSFDENAQNINALWRSEIKNLLITILAKTNNSTFKSLDLNFSKQKNEKQQEWAKIKQQITEIKSHTFSGKIDNFLNSILKRNK